jgi:hypothetical protein
VAKICNRVFSDSPSTQISGNTKASTRTVSTA